MEGIFPSSYVRKTDEEALQEQIGLESSLSSEADSEKQQRRRDARNKMKGEMKDLQDEHLKLQQRREIIEKEVRELTETSQRLNKVIIALFTFAFRLCDN